MAALTTLMIAVCYVWIAVDPLMQESFLVYGRAFRAAVGMKAWGIMCQCGWRLCIVVATIGTTIWFAFDAIVLSGNETTISIKVAWSINAALAAAMIPWRFAVVAHQHRRDVDALVYELTDTAQRIASFSDMDATFDPAGYNNAEDWVAWHPSQAEFSAADDASIWRRVVPVFYTSPTHPGTVVIPIDWSNFAVWGMLPAVPRAGEHLPFRGPGQSEFSFRSIRQLESRSNCWVLCADMEFPDDDTWIKSDLNRRRRKHLF